MRKRTMVVATVLVLCFSTMCVAEEEQKNRLFQLKDDIVQDYKHFYSGHSLIKLGLGVGVAGILANTSADQELREWYQGDVRSGDTDDLADAVEQLGDLAVVAPFILGASLLGEIPFLKDNVFGSTFGEWGQRSARGLIVGSSSMVLLQYGLGASRPNEDDSDWKPFDDNNSVSGHSFIGAVPLITAARMTENIYLKSLFYVASTLTGLSRINDDKHYSSQVLLGWWLAYLAAESVDRTEEQKVMITPVVLRGGAGVRLTKRF